MPVEHVLAQSEKSRLDFVPACWCGAKHGRYRLSEQVTVELHQPGECWSKASNAELDLHDYHLGAARPETPGDSSLRRVQRDASVDDGCFTDRSRFPIAGLGGVR